MGVLDDAIREHLDLKRRRGASDDEIAQAEAEALGPARRAPSLDGEDDDGFDPGETIVIPPAHDPAPPPAAATRVIHDIDEDPLAPPAPVDRVERPDVALSPLDQDTAEHPPPDRLPFGDDDHDDDDDNDDDPAPAATRILFDHEDDDLPPAPARPPGAAPPPAADSGPTDDTVVSPPASAERDTPAPAPDQDPDGPGRVSE